MTKNTLNVLVYGATGSQSSPVVWHLLERGHKPTVVTRNPEKATAFQAKGVEVVVADMADRASLVKASMGKDAVSLLIPFFVNPMEAPTYAKNAIDAAKEAGVKLIVWNTSGLVPQEKTGNPGIDVRVDTFNYLRESGIPHIVIEPGAYIENLLGPWTAPFVANEGNVTYPLPSNFRVAWTPSDDVGALIVEALEHPELANSYFKVSGIELVTGDELAEQFSQALERPIGYRAMKPQDFGAILDTMFGAGAGALAAQEYQRFWDNPNNQPIMHADMSVVLQKLPVKMTTIKEWVIKYRDAFTANVPVS
ncbi:MAG: NmrA family NAD(P)-binding protein [bacterium]|nr:NmrA family NAD(P)-binding protein [bacterium]